MSDRILKFKEIEEANEERLLENFKKRKEAKQKAKNDPTQGIKKDKDNIQKDAVDNRSF